MDTVEPLHILNRRLKEVFGPFMSTELPAWRISWSDEEIEKRLVTHTKDGFELLNPQVAEIPKYPYIRSRFILERAIEFPEAFRKDRAEKITYEPVWTFEDSKGEYLPPKWEVCFLVINQVYEQAQRYNSEVKYKDPNIVDPKDVVEKQKADVDAIIEELFGNETDTGDALAYKEGIVVPRNYERM